MALPDAVRLLEDRIRRLEETPPPTNGQREEVLPGLQRRLADLERDHDEAQRRLLRIQQEGEQREAALTQRLEDALREREALHQRVAERADEARELRASQAATLQAIQEGQERIATLEGQFPRNALADVRQGHVHPALFGSGAPTVNARRDSFYVDRDTDTLYLNTDGAATWTSIGGGAAGNHNMLDGSVHPDSVADAVSAGSLIIGNDTPKWDELVIAVPAANVRNVLGIDNGETTPSWKTALDGTNPADIAAAASPGTSLVFAHRDHVHNLGIGTTRGDLLVWDSTPVAVRLAAGSPWQILRIDTNGDLVWDDDLLRSGASFNQTWISYGGYATHRFQSANGTLGAVTATADADGLGMLSFWGYNGSAFIQTADVVAIAAENWSVGNNGTYLRFRTTPIGSATVATAFEVNPAGAVIVTGTISESAEASDNVRFGVLSGTPRIILEEGGVAQWEIDTSGGSLRFFVPGDVKMALDSSGNLTLDGTVDGVDVAAHASRHDNGGADAMAAASTTDKGLVELATAAETDTGTDATRAVTPDGLAGSIHGKKIVYITVMADDTALATGDGQAYWTVPSDLDGMNLVDADAAVYTASSSGTPTIQIHNVDNALDMLSTRITIDANELNSYTAATAPVINTSNDHVNEGDRIRVDVDVAGTGTKGLDVILVFQTP